MTIKKRIIELSKTAIVIYYLYMASCS